MDIQERLTAFAMLGAGWVMWLLVALSIVAVAIAIERAYVFFLRRDDARALREDLQRFLGKGDVAGAQARMKQSKSFEAEVVGAALGIVDQGAHAVEQRLEGEKVLARAAMERNLAFLGTVGNNAPFVGLLGTVIGIIRAFAALDQDNLDATGAVMAEVGEALVATAIGLLVALPAVVFYNYYQRVIRGRLVWADAMGRDVVGFVGADPAPASASKADKASGKEKS
jgi:biopolymer transport protein ExbB